MNLSLLQRCAQAATGALCAGLLVGCVVLAPQRPRPAPTVHADVVLAAERGMRSIVFDARAGYLSLSNTAFGGTQVMRTNAVINRASVWSPVDLEACALGPARDGAPLRAPALTRLDGKIYLFQSTFGSAKEHSLCQFERAMEWFAPRDQGLRGCTGLYCERLWMTDLQS
jgi:hypothetical protein